MSLLAAAFSLAAVQAASAADMPTKAPAPMMAPAYNWTGWYVGINAGGGWGTRTGDLDSNVGLAAAVAGGAVPASYNINSSGIIGGLQLGYNWQTGSFVLGVETDIQASGIRGTSTVLFPGGGGFVPTTSVGEEKVTWFGTTRLRGGIAVAERGLLYATGGFAYGGVKDSGTVVGTPPATGNFAGSTSETKFGWALGGGAEWALTNNWLLRAEYLYVDLGRTMVTGTDPAFPGVSATYAFRHRENIARVAVSYKF